MYCKSSAPEAYTLIMAENAAVKLAALRHEIKAAGLDGFIIPRTDEFQGEYVPASAERLAWLTGFTGSAGIAVVLADKAVVMTDARYTEPLARQIDHASFEVADSGAMSPGKWLAAKAAKNVKIGYDPKLHTQAELTAWEKQTAQRKIDWVAVQANPLDAVWRDRPPAPATPVELFPDEIAGRGAAEKRELLAQVVRTANAAAVIVALPESVAWLLNIRGNDVPHVPLALSQAIAYADGAVDWVHCARSCCGAGRPALDRRGTDFAAGGNVVFLAKIQ